MDPRRYSFFLWAPFIIGNVAETLTRSKFEEFNMDLFRSNMKPVQMVMEDADMQKKDVDEIVLVEGFTHIPMVQKLVKEDFKSPISPKGDYLLPV